MRTKILASVLLSLPVLFAGQALGFQSVQITQSELISIVRAEDELRFDQTLRTLLASPNPLIRRRAALAAGRIGDEDAIPRLAQLLGSDADSEVRKMAAFALGEIESIKAADALLPLLRDSGNWEGSAIPRSLEAAGKIVAANAKDEKSEDLRAAILENLEFQAGRSSRASEGAIMLGITAVLRAKSKGADETLAKFLGNANWKIRADALNALARLAAKNVNAQARRLLVDDVHPIVRANAARVLGAAVDKTAVELLLKRATRDPDSRVRVNAIRALSGFTESSIAEQLLARAAILAAKSYRFVAVEAPISKNPIEKNELLTIASALGRILKGTRNSEAIQFLNSFSSSENHHSPEIEIALARIDPASYLAKGAYSSVNFRRNRDGGKYFFDWRLKTAIFSGLGELADIGDLPENLATTKKAGEIFGSFLANPMYQTPDATPDSVFMALPDALSGFQKFAPDDLVAVLLKYLKHSDFVVRTTAASLLGDVNASDPNQAARIYRALATAYSNSVTDESNDASLAILDAMAKQYKNRPKPMPIKVPYFAPFISAARSPDYLVRRKAAEIHNDLGIKRKNAGGVERVDFGRNGFALPHSRVVGADYSQAVSRRNGKSNAVLKTEKGNFTIAFFPKEAPLTVENFIKLAKSGYFDGLEIHRVVPNFVMQDGDPRGDGNGGPGWQIRCEINQIPYERGTVGMALSGKDTGGSQWFVTHSRQPHLDGGYTVFGKVSEKDMVVVDALVRGDKILSVTINEKKK